MMLSGARVATGAEDSSCTNLLIRRDRVFISSATNYRSRKLDLSGFMILPGLINSHDHLELNLFPRLGRGPYRNAIAWAQDIYRPNESPVKQQLSVPKPIRLFCDFGILKWVLPQFPCRFKASVDVTVWRRQTHKVRPGSAEA